MLRARNIIGGFTEWGTVKEKARWTTVSRVLHLCEGTLSSVGKKVNSVANVFLWYFTSVRGYKLLAD